MWANLCLQALDEDSLEDYRSFGLYRNCCSHLTMCCQRADFVAATNATDFQMFPQLSLERLFAGQSPYKVTRGCQLGGLVRASKSPLWVFAGARAFVLRASCRQKVKKKLIYLTVCLSFAGWLTSQMTTQKRLIQTIGESRHAHSQNFQETDSFQLVAKLRAAIERKATSDP